MLVSSIINISLASFGRMTHFENTYKMYKYLLLLNTFKTICTKRYWHMIKTLLLMRVLQHYSWIQYSLHNIIFSFKSL